VVHRTISKSFCSFASTDAATGVRVGETLHVDVVDDDDSNVVSSLLIATWGGVIRCAFGSPVELSAAVRVMDQTTTKNGSLRTKRQ
jgi:hypothetical protein